MLTLLYIIGLVLTTLMLGSVAVLPFRPESPDRGMIAAIAGISSGVGTLFVALVFIPDPVAFFAAIGLVFLVGVLAAFMSAAILVGVFPRAKAFLAGEKLVEIDKLSPQVRRAVRPYVRGRWITETELQERFAKSARVLKQMAAASTEQTTLLKNEAIRTRMEAQERLFERMTEEERGLFSVRLFADAEAKARIQTELEEVTRERDHLRHLIAAQKAQSR